MAVVRFRGWRVMVLSCAAAAAGAWGGSSRGATINVPAGNNSALSSAMTNAQPGDVIVLNGAYTTGITTRVDGTAAAPITIMAGPNGASLNNSTGKGEGIEVNNDYYVFQGITLNGFQESFRTYGANYGVANGIVANGSRIEAFKFKNSSTHWLVENCSVSNAGMEGYYCGDADQNWSGGVPDQTAYVTFYHDTAFQTYNDGFDCKEGTHDIRIIDSLVDWNNTVPGGNNEGNSGVYDRANGMQVINLNTRNNGSAGNGVRANRMTAMDGVTYGSGLQVYGLAASNMQGTLLSTNQRDTALYTNYSMTNVAGGIGSSGATQPAPATFAENLWAATEGEFLPINMNWDNSLSGVGDGSTWDYSSQNFNDVGSNGGIPVMFFAGVGVTFNDTNNGHYQVTIGANVTPGSVTVNNSAGDYAFSGTGGIAGSGGLTKRGTGTLTIGTSNSYTGGTTISDGRVVVTNSNALGALTGGAVTINGGTLDLSGVSGSNALNFGQKAFILSGSGAGGIGAIYSNASVSQNRAFQQVMLAGDATIGGEGGTTAGRYDVRGSSGSGGNTGLLDLAGHTLTKIGTNQVSLVATDVTSGDITVNGGIFSIETSSNIAGTGTITYNDGTRAQFYSNTGNVSRPMVFNGNVQVGNANSGSLATIASPLTFNGNITLTNFSSPTATGSMRFNGNALEGSGVVSVTKTGASTFTFAGASNGWSGNTTLSGGAILFGDGVAASSSSLGNVTGSGGSLTVSAHAALVSRGIQLNVTAAAAGDVLTVNGALQIRTDGGASSVSALAIGAGGKVDIANNALIVQATPSTRGGAVSMLQSQVAAGGIFSSTLPVDMALAVIDNGAMETPWQNFGGVPVGSGSVIVAPELPGDANADGVVDESDLSVMLNHFGEKTTAWTDGNFDGQGVVNLTDLSLVLNNMGLRNTFISGGAGVSAAGTPAPEPGTGLIAGLGLGGWWWLRRRRRYC